MVDANRVVQPCPSCGQKLRITTDRGDLIPTCLVWRHSWQWETPFDIRNTLWEAVALLKSGTEQGIEQGKALLRTVYENHEWIRKNLWKGAKIVAAITTIISLPGNVAEAADRLQNLLES